ncbi:AI-2E family transporter [Ferrimonas sp.]|uniref:AI-2E family transporter n=1 Tax=Ferrimonas sp. TaxID=2080861 RepID=UPI003A8F613C
MNDHEKSTRQVFTDAAVEAALKIGAIFILLSWCFQIVRPFLVLILWGGIIAVALFPLVRWLSGRFGLKISLASSMVTILVLAVLLVPTYLFSGALFSGTQSLLAEFKEGSLVIPPVSDAIAQLPWVGEELHGLWQKFSVNLGAALEGFGPEIKEALSQVAAMAGSLGLGLLQFVASVIIAGVLMTNADSIRALFYNLSMRMAGEQGRSFNALAVATIRSVMQGVIGVALIQSLLSGIGMGLAGVPGTGLWMLLVLIVAILQLPPLLVLIPVMIYLFSLDNTTVAVAFMIWGLLVGGSDAVLKPLLMGRGVDIPMLIILMGAIGGLLLSGIIGLFVGAVVLALGFKLFTAWLGQEALPEPAATRVRVGPKN